MNYIKNDLKDLRKEIKRVREISKTDESQDKRSEAQCSLVSLKWEFRRKHIFYCLLRGKSYLQIESKVHDGNEVSITDIKTYTKLYEGLSFDEISKEQLKGLNKW